MWPDSERVSGVSRAPLLSIPCIHPSSLACKTNAYALRRIHPHGHRISTRVSARTRFREIYQIDRSLIWSRFKLSRNDRLLFFFKTLLKLSFFFQFKHSLSFVLSRMRFFLFFWGLKKICVDFEIRLHNCFFFKIYVHWKKMEKWKVRLIIFCVYFFLIMKLNNIESRFEKRDCRTDY